MKLQHVIPHFLISLEVNKIVLAQAKCMIYTEIKKKVKNQASSWDVYLSGVNNDYLEQINVINL